MGKRWAGILLREKIIMDETDNTDSSVKLELLDLTTKQKEVLAAALDASDRRATGDHRVLQALRRRHLISDVDHTLLDRGRYQVRWYVEEAAEHWGVQPDSFGHYVARGRAPAPDGYEPRATTARAWWHPTTITKFDRGPGRGNFERIEIEDMSTVIRQYRAGISIRAIAKSLEISPTTLANRLEEAGEKPTTSSSRTAYRRDQRPTISAESAG